MKMGGGDEVSIQVSEQGLELRHGKWQLSGISVQSPNEHTSFTLDSNNG